ncbi:hypothetical protein JCM25156A_32800 [Komagataeibacter kakiaceti JCM 25156]|uniref:hypothetical protein n=1 Tax=Komagataeibacter kakiaceti TaxID=943261 RepID=UPI00046EE21B|nr:hypothetical protein [Komagataeibacter kakiaceti]MCE2580869.1 hypothetical protein [Komagataeibacter sp. FNDCR1]
MTDREEDAKAETDNRIAPWTIKGIPPEIRNAAIAAAKREKQTIGEWLGRAIRTQVQADTQADRAPVPVNPQATPQADMSEVERLIQMATTLANTPGGDPVPKTISRTANGLIRDRLRQLKKGGR